MLRSVLDFVLDNVDRFEVKRAVDPSRSLPVGKCILAVVLAAAVAAFIISYVLTTGVSLPGAVIMTLAGGFLFGSVLGTLYVNIEATTGATLPFLAARYLLREWVEGFESIKRE